MYSIVEFKMRVLEESPKVLSPNRRIFFTAVSLDSKGSGVGCGYKFQFRYRRGKED